MSKIIAEEVLRSVQGEAKSDAGDISSPVSELPGDPGLWTFIVADMFAFALFFLIFSVARIEAPDLFEESRQLLDVRLGLINTLVLLTSSLFMVRTVECARQGDRSGVQRNLILTIVTGFPFAVVKIIEYSEKIHSGVTMLTNEFFTYYFVFTGVHFLHFIVGCGALIVCFSKSRNDPMDKRFITWAEATGCYWHMVDLLWIMLFPMLYLLG